MNGLSPLLFFSMVFAMHMLQTYSVNTSPVKDNRINDRSLELFDTTDIGIKRSPPDVYLYHYRQYNSELAGKYPYYETEKEEPVGLPSLKDGVRYTRLHTTPSTTNQIQEQEESSGEVPFQEQKPLTNSKVFSANIPIVGQRAKGSHKNVFSTPRYVTDENKISLLNRKGQSVTKKPNADETQLVNNTTIKPHGMNIPEDHMSQAKDKSPINGLGIKQRTSEIQNIKTLSPKGQWETSISVKVKTEPDLVSAKNVKVTLPTVLVVPRSTNDKQKLDDHHPSVHNTSDTFGGQTKNTNSDVNKSSYTPATTPMSTGVNGITHGSDECLKVFPASKQQFGLEFAHYTEPVCLSLCFGLRECAAVDFDRHYNVCRVHQTTTATSQHYDPCCVHYKRNPCPKGLELDNFVEENGHIVNGELTLGASLKSKACDRHNVTMTLDAGVSQYGGIRREELGSETEDACQQLCIKDASCKATDFNIDEGSCWVHYASNKAAWENTTCCNHYEKQEKCENDCFDVYQTNKVSKIADTRVAGIPLTVCKQHCVEDYTCAAFSYNSDEAYCLLYKDTASLSSQIAHDTCCSLWIKKTCYDTRNDTLITGILFTPTTTTSSITTTTTTIESTTTSISRSSSSTTARILDLTIPDFVAPTLETPKTENNNFWMSTSSIIVIAGCVFVVIVGVIALVAFAAHRRKERKKIENDVLNPTHPRNWIINHRHRNSGGSSLLAFWQSDLHPDRRGDTPSHTARRTASLPPARATDLELYPIQRSQLHSSYVSDPLFVQLPEVQHNKRFSYPSYCTFVRPSTYPDSAQLSGLHSPKRLPRYDATAVHNNDAMYNEEIGDTDRFYKAGECNKPYSRTSTSGSAYP